MLIVEKKNPIKIFLCSLRLIRKSHNHSLTKQDLTKPTLYLAAANYNHLFNLSWICASYLHTNNNHAVGVLLHQHSLLSTLQRAKEWLCALFAF